MPPTDKSIVFRRIAIVGSGALGCYYGARLAQKGHEVHFLMRSDLKTVREHGLTIKSIAGDFQLQPVNCHATPDEIGPCDLIIIALKTTANATLTHLLPPLLKDQTVLLTLQNGLGNEDLLAKAFGPERIMGGLCFVCINRLSPGVIEHSAQGQIHLGEYSGSPQERTHALAEMFRSSQVPCQVEPNLLLARWRKLVWNIPFNGLSIAAGGIDTETLLNDPALTFLAKDLMLEVISTANALGYPLPEDLADGMISMTRGIGAYKTSSLIDYLHGREVEVESIWLEPCRQAQAASVPVPKLEMLCSLLQHLVKQKNSPPAN